MACHGALRHRAVWRLVTCGCFLRPFWCSSTLPLDPGQWMTSPWMMSAGNYEVLPTLRSMWETQQYTIPNRCVMTIKHMFIQAAFPEEITRQQNLQAHEARFKKSEVSSTWNHPLTRFILPWIILIWLWTNYTYKHFFSQWWCLWMVFMVILWIQPDKL